MNTSALQMCPTWKGVRDVLGSFPHQNFGYEFEGGLGETSWIFRGSKSSQYRLEPKVERQRGCNLEWPALESKILLEFRSRARMFFNASEVPEPSDRLGWLALMQHYGIATRLLDFTFSPYVALYFALVDRTPEEQKYQPEVWAINTRPLMKVADATFFEAIREQARIRSSTHGSIRTAASLDPRTAISDREVIEDEASNRHKMLNQTLSPNGILRDCFNKKGFVALALPPIQNRRLSSQQGAFLFTGSEDRTFHDSLELMMKDHEGEWCRRIQIGKEVLVDAERHLVRMNVHHLSLFPDVEGLAGFIRQKTRLHWAPDDSPVIVQKTEDSP